MNQCEIQIRTSEIIRQYARRNQMSFSSVLFPVLRILRARGIKPTMPMYATARLLVLRDLLRVWEAQ